MTKEIQLTQGKVALVDDDVYEWASKFKWHARRDESRFYVQRKIKNFLGEWAVTLHLHREIMDAPVDMTVDHINGDGLDCRRENMRLATNTENGCNRRPNANNTSGYKGVTLHKQMGRWRARIMVNQKPIHLGFFNDLVEAAQAYDNAAIEYHGEFARLNFP